MIPVILQDNWLPYLVAALATWRISNMVLFETGPWFVFTKIRRLFGVKHDDAGDPIAWPDGSVLICLWCFSVWIGLLVTVVPWWLWAPFALSAAAIMIGRWINGSSNH